MKRKKNDQLDKTKEKKRTGLLEVLKNLDGKEFIVTVPIMEEEEKHERTRSV